MFVESLPEAFLARMQSLLGGAYPQYLEAMTQPAFRGFRINTLKISEEDFFRIIPFARRPAPFAANSYYLENEIGAGALPAHAAGLFYIQEPSAASAVEILDPRPDMKVLDLCAAPGSKTMQIAERLGNRGFLVANEVHPGRARVLAQNIERWGAANVMVLNSTSSQIARAFGPWFDTVLCDAPCSGEGMFRKDPRAAAMWSVENVRACARRQRMILEDAAACLRPGGKLVYSTCTFSREENEDNILAFLKEHPEMTLVEKKVSFGHTSPYVPACRRIYPMDGGEGHFVACLCKENIGRAAADPCLLKGEPLAPAAQTFLQENLSGSYPYLLQVHDCVYGGCTPFYQVRGCHLVRHQVFLGTMRNGRFEPGQGLYLSSFAPPARILEVSEEEARRFLHGQPLSAYGRKGWYGVSRDHFCLGFGKADGTVLKNKYPRELRLREESGE